MPGADDGRFDLAAKRVLLTGASGGLGTAIARRLARYGAMVTLTARRADVMQPLAEEIGGNVVVADLTSQSDVDRLADSCADFDVLVANAGVGGDSTATRLGTDAIDRTIGVNLRAPMVLAGAFTAQHARPAPAPRTHQIVFVGSLSGLAPTPGTCLYNATKFGLRGFALSFRQDAAPHGVGVSIVEPGFVRDAGMFAENDVELPAGVRTRTPEDVAMGVEHAVRHNPAEHFVAPVELRWASTLATVAPGLSERVQRRLGTAEMRSGS